AASAIMRAFDEWQHDAMQNHLLSGDPNALGNYLAARRANTDLMNSFGYNGRTEGESFVNDIATGDITPNQLAEKLIGARPGEKGISSQLVEAIGTATGNDPAAQQSMRGAIWNRLRGAAEGETARSPEKIASDIYRFVDGPG